MRRLLKNKKSIVILLIISIILTLSNNIYATDGIISGADAFLSKGTEDILKNDNIKQTSDTIYNILMAVGTVIVLVVGAVLGVQFILGSLEEKAKVHEALVPFVIGAIVIYGSLGIWKLAVLVFQNM